MRGGWEGGRDFCFGGFGRFWKEGVERGMGWELEILAFVPFRGVLLGGLRLYDTMRDVRE